MGVLLPAEGYVGMSFYRWSLLAIALTVITGAYLLAVPAPQEDIKGAIWIKGLDCYPTGAGGHYGVQLRAQNTTDSDLRNVELRFLAGDDNELGRAIVMIPKWQRGEIIDESATLGTDADLNVCIARFYTGADVQIPATYRP